MIFIQHEELDILRFKLFIVVEIFTVNNQLKNKLTLDKLNLYKSSNL